MKSVSVYNYDNYRDFLKGIIKENKETRGFQAQIAKSAPCQSSYLSQVLHSSIQLTPEQALGISHFLNMDENEKEYFVLLVQLDRSGSIAYKSWINAKLKTAKEKGKDIAERVPSKTISNTENNLTYYTAWYWSAIHVILGIPQYQTVPSIAQRLSLPESFTEYCLQQLKALNLVSQKGPHWERLVNHLHLPKSSPLTGVQHNTWRMKAANNALFGNPESFHYSAVYTMSVKDYETIKMQLQDLIVEIRQRVDRSPEEDVVSIGLDCFRL